MFVFLAILEGLNKVEKIFFYKSIYMFILVSIQVILLFLDFSYEAIVYALLTSVLVTYLIIIINHLKEVLNFALFATKNSNLSITRDVLKFQLRNATSWVFGFVPIQIMPTFIAAGLGLDWTARIGMTQQIITAISATSFVFIQIIVPKIGQLASESNIKQIKLLYRRALKYSLVVAIIGICLTIFLYIFAKVYYEDILERVVPINLLVPFLSLVIVNWITFARAALGRAFHEEIMLSPTILSGVCIILLLELSEFITANILILFYVVISWLTSVLIGGILFRKFINKKGL